MKKKILIFACTCFLAMLCSPSFSQTAAQQEANDYQQFKKDAQMKIDENKQKIADLKDKKSNESKEVRDKYDKKVANLEQKNNELRKKIDNYNESSNSTKWASFKREFNHDMDELGKSIKDIGKDNVK
jgi:peptidoglycan hydrolase CwlO-like protein